MDYIILDLEWNQPEEGRDFIHKELPFEIIEIGAIKLDGSRKIIGEFNQLIKPQVYHHMNHVTEKMVRVDMQQLNKGESFVTVIEDFLEWCGEDYIFCTWGPLDLIELQRNMRYYNIPALNVKPFPFYDVQKLFSIAYEDRKLRRSLEFAVDYLKIEKDIPFHRAFSDAYYTAKVFGTITKEWVLTHYSYDIYHLPRNKAEEIHIVFEDYAKYISREFGEKVNALRDREVISTKCYYCNRPLKRKIKWFSPNGGKHYYSVSYCDKHGYMKGKIRLKKSEKGKLYVIKTLKFIDNSQVEEIINKRKKNKTLLGR